MHRTHVTLVTLFAVLPMCSIALAKDGLMDILNNDYVCTINGQVFRGTLCYPAPTRSEGGTVYLTPQFGGPENIYLIVEDPDQVFVYDAREAKKHAAEQEKLFGPQGWDLKAKAAAVRLDEQRWRVSGNLPRGHWQLVFGKHVEGGISARFPSESNPAWDSPWVLNTNGLTFPQEIQPSDASTDDYRFKGGMEWIVAVSTQRVAAKPKDPKLYLKRGLAYATLGELEKAHADLKKGGGTLLIDVRPPDGALVGPSEGAPLTVPNKKDGNVPFGTRLTVKAVNGKWLWIDERQVVKKEYFSGGKMRTSSETLTLRGWLDAKYAKHVLESAN